MAAVRGTHESVHIGACALGSTRALTSTATDRMRCGPTEPAVPAGRAKVPSTSGAQVPSVAVSVGSTRWSVLASYRHATELQIDLITGRRNQIRLHFAHAGHALAGERKYAYGRDSQVRIKSRRVALHAWHVEFPHPRTHATLSVECPLPDDLMELRTHLADA